MGESRLEMQIDSCLEDIVCDRKAIFARLATVSRTFPDVGCTNLCLRMLYLSN
jgi:hypothetical protein